MEKLQEIALAAAETDHNALAEFLSETANEWLAKHPVFLNHNLFCEMDRLIKAANGDVLSHVAIRTTLQAFAGTFVQKDDPSCNIAVGLNALVSGVGNPNAVASIFKGLIYAIATDYLANEGLLHKREIDDEESERATKHANEVLVHLMSNWLGQQAA